MEAGLISRRNFVKLGSAATLSACLHEGALLRPQAGRPNIVFILADDLGYADLSCYGRRDYTTPGIDALAAQGAQFLSAYASSPVCSPTRTALITGRYQYRLPVGLEEPLGAREIGLPPEHPTLPSLLRQQGYQTALVGKWHMGRLPDYGPLRSGYDHFWGFRHGAIDYYSHDGPWGHDLWDQDVPVEATGYLTDLLGERAVNMIDRFAGSGEPFMLSLHFSAPHWPWQGRDGEAESDRLKSLGPRALLHWDGGSMETYRHMVEAMDVQVGRVMAALDANGLRENTIVVFTSDNGGERFSDTWPFSGRKTELLEGGIRVPCILRWPERIAAGVEVAEPNITMDWVATLLAACGAEPDPDYPLDGVDLLAGPGSAGERTLFWRYRHLDQQACRQGRWKYLRIAGNSFLFDLDRDPMERANLRDRYPQKFSELVEAYNAWNAGMLPFDPASNSHGFTGRDVADRFGVKAD